MARSSPLALVLLACAATLAPRLTAADPAAARRVDVKVTDAGFEPRQIKARAGEPLTIAFTRTSERTCMTAIDIPDEGVKELELPLNQTVTVTITPTKKGTERFHCSAMGMGNGRIVVQ